MLTAAITAAIAAVLALFGIEPGPYLVGVAIGVKVVIVAVGLLFGVRWFRRRSRPSPPAGAGPPSSDG